MKGGQRPSVVKGFQQPAWFIQSESESGSELGNLEGQRGSGIAGAVGCGWRGISSGSCNGSEGLKLTLAGSNRLGGLRSIRAVGGAAWVVARACLHKEGRHWRKQQSGGGTSYCSPSDWEGLRVQPSGLKPFHRIRYSARRRRREPTGSERLVWNTGEFSTAPGANQAQLPLVR